MQYKPHRTVKQTAIIGFVLLLIAAIFLCMANFSLGFIWLNQLGGISAITALIYLMIRYIMTDFVYQLPDAGARFTVKKLRGNLPQTVAEIDLSPADRIIPYDKNVLRKEGVIRTENFCVSLFPEESYALITIVGGRKTALRLECKADTAERIRERMASLPPKEDTP